MNFSPFLPAGFFLYNQFLSQDAVTIGLIATTTKGTQFEKESFGALHQMMSSLSDPEKETVWAEIERELQKFEAASRFVSSCEMFVAIEEKL